MNRYMHVLIAANTCAAAERQMQIDSLAMPFQRIAQGDLLALLFLAVQANGQLPNEVKAPVGTSTVLGPDAGGK